MDDTAKPSNHEFVLHAGPGSAPAVVRRRLGSAGTAEPIPGHPNLFLVNLSEAPKTARDGWVKLRSLLGATADVSPVLIDAQGTRRYAVGELVARFHGVPTPAELRKMKKLGLTVKGGSQFVPQQVKLKQRADRFLPDALADVREAMPDVPVWMETLSPYRRS